MRKSNPSLLFDPEIERTARANRKTAREAKASASMAEEQPADQRVLADYFTVRNDAGSAIVRPPFGVANFDIKPYMITFIQQNCQFTGLAHEDARDFVRNFLVECDNLQAQGVSSDAIRLRVFPYVLLGEAKAWLNMQPSNSFHTWDQLKTAFLERFCAVDIQLSIQQALLSFEQRRDESFAESWRRFQILRAKCPDLQLSTHVLSLIFYKGLQVESQRQVNAAAGGCMKTMKTPDECMTLFESMAKNEYRSERTTSRQPGALNVDTNTAILAKLEALTLAVQNQSAQKQVQAVNSVPFGPACELCGGNHPSGECLFDNSQGEQINYMGNGPRYNNGGQNSGFRNHPGFSYNNNYGRPPPPPPQHVPERKPDLEAILGKFMETTEARFKNVEAAVKNIEVQLGQLSQKISERPQGALPSNTEPNPREFALAVTLRSGREIPDPVKPQKKQEPEEPEKTSEGETVAAERVYVPPTPYPQRLIPKKELQEKQYAQILKMFKQLQIHIPLLEAITQIPSCTKFFKQLFSKKKRIGEADTVVLNEECSAILLNKLPPKKKDPGSFTIPCQIGQTQFQRALLDLGASINLMPLSIFRKLGLGEVKPTRISLQLADRSLAFPKGVVEDVLVRVGNLLIPVDFVVLDMEEDREVPLILGRPFLATAGAVIDVQAGKLELNVLGQQATFNVFEAAKHTLEDMCYRVDAVENLTTGPPQVTDKDSPLGPAFLSQRQSPESGGKVRKEEEDHHPPKKKKREKKPKLGVGDPPAEEPGPAVFRGHREDTPRRGMAFQAFHLFAQCMGQPP